MCPKWPNTSAEGQVSHLDALSSSLDGSYLQQLYIQHKDKNMHSENGKLTSSRGGCFACSSWGSCTRQLMLPLQSKGGPYTFPCIFCKGEVKLHSTQRCRDPPRLSQTVGSVSFKRNRGIYTCWDSFSPLAVETMQARGMLTINKFLHLLCSSAKLF